jgi:hypothetical protein
VYVNHGRWVARCPRPGCYNAEAFGKCADGTTGGLTASGEFHCRNEYAPNGQQYDGCGLTCPADWPAPDMVPAVEQLLSPRPAPVTRNWHPGETLADLQAENFEHGIVPAAALAGHKVQIIGDDAPPAALGGFTDRPELEG